VSFPARWPGLPGFFSRPIPQPGKQFAPGRSVSPEIPLDSRGAGGKIAAAAFRLSQTPADPAAAWYVICMMQGDGSVVSTMPGLVGTN
jgi:hypothetical protein